MAGNVWEWNQDLGFSDANRVIRGGSWDGGAHFCRSAIRGYVSPDSRDRSLGYCLARSLEP